jgi:replicative DNA helicase
VNDRTLQLAQALAESYVSAPRVGPMRGSDAAEWYEDKLANPPDAEDDGIRTPWPDLLGTMRKGRMHLLGGYPADGKTAMMLQFLVPACEQGKKASVHSLEMTAEELIERIVASFGVPYNIAQSGRVHGPIRDNALRAVEAMSRWDFEIHDEPDQGPQEIEQIISSSGADVGFVDHIHAFGHGDRHQLEQTARSLKGVAKRQGVPLLLLAHLSRAQKFKHGASAFPRPDMSRLRDSGMLEAWADTVWFAWRHRDEMDLPLAKGELIVAKSRFTRTGMAELVFDGNFQRWEGGHT